jgi:zinc protease
MEHIACAPIERHPMFSRTALPTVIALVATFVAPAISLAQQLSHEKYALPNGMTVILHQDRSVPQVAVNIWYRVGARNEPVGRSGFAHLFEHLMFMGTHRVPGSDFDVIMETGGGANNASTSLDRTNYFSSGPSSLLPTLLWLDADRLEDMGLYMTKEKVDKQIAVVRNERRQVIENAPYQKAADDSTRLMYPDHHPYYNGVMGPHATIESATVQDVKDFFASFYVPSNASLVVAGDFDPAVVKPMIADLFGTLPPGNVATARPVPDATLSRVVRQTSLDKVAQPGIFISYHSPAFYAEGDAEMDLIGAMLATGNNSRLYKRLVVEEQLATDVMAYQESAGLSSLFRVSVIANPDARLEAIEKIIDEEIAALTTNGPEAADLASRKSAVELSKVASLQSLEARADRLNEYDYFLGTPDGLQQDLARYRSVTAESIKSWTTKVLTPNARLVQYVLPEEVDRSTNPRDERPKDFAKATFSPPMAQAFTLKNGLQVQVFSKPGLPLAHMELIAKPQATTDTVATMGRAVLMADMLSEGTKTLTGEQFASELQSIGGSFDAGASQDEVTASMTMLKSGLEKGMTLFSQALTAPRMSQADFDRVKSLHLQDLAQANDDPNAIAGKVGARMVWDATNPYSVPAAGTVASVSPLTLADVTTAHTSLVSPANSTLIVSGDISLAEAQTLVTSALGGWMSSAAPLATTQTSFAATQTSNLRIYVVDRPGAVQTVVHLRSPASSYAQMDRPTTYMLNTILGGSFTSRLNQNLRERNGFTYGAGSRVQAGRNVGQFFARTSVQSAVTAPALKEFFFELARIKSGDISQDEAAKARETVTNDVVSSFGTLEGTAGSATQIISVGGQWTDIAGDLAGLQSVDASKLNTAASQFVQLKKAVLVLVGDKATIMSALKDPSLADLQLPEPMIVDAEGNPIGS